MLNTLLQETDAVDVRGYLHRDGSVLMQISVEDLQNPQALYQAVGGYSFSLIAWKCGTTTLFACCSYGGRNVRAVVQHRFVVQRTIYLFAISLPSRFGVVSFLSVFL